MASGGLENHPGSFEDAHALRDGHTWPAATDTGEEYDLIVVGGGISGLSAAHFYRAKASKSRILILDNHDDFGGHAKRNEFDLNGQLHLMNGGTLEIDSPRPYGPVAANLLKSLGLDVPALIKSTQHLKFYKQRGLKVATFFDQETFGADKLIAGPGAYERDDSIPIEEALREAPLSELARKQIVQIETANIDYFPGLSSADKKNRLSRMSYEAFLRDVVHADPMVLKFYYARTMGEFGVGTDAVNALDCWVFELPGFQGMKLAKGPIPPGSGLENLVTSRVNYAELDRSASAVRLRLNSIVTRARHLGSTGSAKQVEVTYVRGGKPFTARAGGVVLACYNMMIPYLCPELPDNYHTYFHLNPHVTIGGYQGSSTPQDPILVHMVRTPCKAGLPEHDQNRAGRAELLATSFETFERNIRDQLGRTLKDGGFDPALDITAITVNRWPHGYAPEYNPLFDPDVPEEQQPHVLGRARFGRISIANSDSGGAAYTDSAINQGHRAVTELLHADGA